MSKIIVVTTEKYDKDGNLIERTTDEEYVEDTFVFPPLQIRFPDKEVWKLTCNSNSTERWSETCAC